MDEKALLEMKSKELWQSKEKKFINYGSSHERIMAVN